MLPISNFRLSIKLQQNVMDESYSLKFTILGYFGAFWIFSPHEAQTRIAPEPSNVILQRF